MKPSDSKPADASSLASGSLNPGRRKILAVAAASAAVAGASVAWWQTKADVLKDGDEPFPGFWLQQWQSPEGKVLAMQSFRNRPLLINFWATWCPPCIEELPLINAFYLQNKANGWQVLALAIDKPSAVKAFLAKSPLDCPVGMAGLIGAEWGRSLGNLTGGLPFSAVIGSAGLVLHRKLGRLSSADLESWAQLK